MKFRTVLCVLGLIFGTMLAPKPVYAGDAVRTAAYLANHQIVDGYHVNGYYYDKAWKYFSMTFSLSGEITSLVMDDVQLVIDEPLPGFPTRADGTPYQLFEMYSVWGADESNVILRGTFKDSSLTAGEPIVIPMELSEISTLLMPQIPKWVKDKTGLELTVDGTTTRAVYSTYDRGFRVWVNPVEPFAFTVKDARGVFVTGGEFDPFVGEFDPDAQEVASGIGVTLPDGVIEITMPPISEYGYASLYLRGQTLAKTTIGGAEVDARVYFVQAEGSMCAEAYTANFKSAQVEVRDATTLDVVANEVQNTYVPNAGTYVITITPLAGETWSTGQQFFLNINVTNGGGCGKG